MGFAAPNFTREPFSVKETQVVDLDTARQAKADDAEKKLLDETDKKKKGPAIEKIYSDRLLRGKGGQWAAMVPDGTSGAVIHRWNSIYWEAVGGEDGMAMVTDWLDAYAPSMANATVASSCWRYASLRLRRVCPLPVLAAKRAILPCADAYLELTSDKITALAPDPKLGMVHAVKVACGTPVGKEHKTKAVPEDSLFGKFLKHALPDLEVRALVQEQCGMTLLPGNYQMAAWWHGKAGSGKSTLAELVELMHRQVARTSLTALKEMFGLEPLVGASLILVDEVESERWAEATFKTLVSGNGVGVNRKNEKALSTYHSNAKWIITSNPPPFVRDKTDGVWRRLSVVHWQHVVPENERVADLHTKIMEQEGRIVLDWMLEGAQRIVGRGRFLAEHEQPNAARLTKRLARENCDSVRSWVDTDRVQFSPGKWNEVNAIYQRYCDWCVSVGNGQEDILSSRSFWRAIRDAGVVTSEKSNRRCARTGKQAWFLELDWLGPVCATDPPQEEIAARVAALPPAVVEQCDPYSETF